MATERVEERAEGPADPLPKVCREPRYRLRLPAETRPHPVHYRGAPLTPNVPNSAFG